MWTYENSNLSYLTLSLDDDALTIGNGPGVGEPYAL